jgi:hypothetical protein
MKWGLILCGLVLSSPVPYLFTLPTSAPTEEGSLDIVEDCEHERSSCTTVLMDTDLLGSPLLYAPSALGPPTLLRLHVSNDTTFHYLADNSTLFSTFIVTTRGITATLTASERGYIHIAPCMSGAPRCHTLLFVDPATLDPETADDVLLDSDSPTSAPSILPPADGDLYCNDGLVSPDGTRCCSSSSCNVTDRPCLTYLAPCDLVVTQTVAVAYTSEAQKVTSDLLGLVRLAIEETNLAYLHSLIPIKLQLFGAPYLNDIAENGDIRGMLMSFKASTVEEGPHLRVLLVTSTASCGIAFLNCALSAQFSCFAVVQLSCATGYYSFGHEIGHLQGAHHNMEAMSFGDDLLDNHGLVLTRGYGSQGAYRTVMAYSLVSELRIAYFSNPSVSVEGHPTGIVGSANNARVMTLSRYAVARLAPLPSPPSKLPTSTRPTKPPTPFPSLRPSKSPTPFPSIPPSASPISNLRPTASPSSPRTASPTPTRFWDWR